MDEREFHQQINLKLQHLASLYNQDHENDVKNYIIKSTTPQPRHIQDIKEPPENYLLSPNHHTFKSLFHTTPFPKSPFHTSTFPTSPVHTSRWSTPQFHIDPLTQQQPKHDSFSVTYQNTQLSPLSFHSSLSNQTSNINKYFNNIHNNKYFKNNDIKERLDKLNFSQHKIWPATSSDYPTINNNNLNPNNNNPSKNSTNTSDKPNNNNLNLNNNLNKNNPNNNINSHKMTSSYDGLSIDDLNETDTMLRPNQSLSLHTNNNSNNNLNNNNNFNNINDINDNNISNQLSQQISYLLYELQRLKDKNNELSEQLSSSQHQLSVTRNQLTSLEASMYSQNKQQNLSVLVEEVYRNQKIRDVAVIDRLKTAKQERDEAVTKADLLQERILGNRNKDDVVSHLMKCHSMDDLKRSTDEFVKMISDEKEARRRMVEEEMEIILVEKDLIHKQKDEIEREKDALIEKLHEEFKKRKQMQEKQKATEKERDTYMNKLQELYEELNKLKVTYNLHGSLTKEKQLHHKFNILLDGAQDEMEEKKKQVRSLIGAKEELLEKVRRFNEDNNLLKTQTTHLQQMLKDEKAEKEQLSRLVAVLRRKLNGT